MALKAKIEAFKQERKGAKIRATAAATATAAAAAISSSTVQGEGPMDTSAG